MTPRGAGPRWALLLLLVLGAARTAAAGEPQLWFLNSLAKPAPVQPSAALLAQFETSPVLHAAWGESEALQLLVLAPPEGLNKLRASCGEFTHPSGDVWAPGTVRCDFVGYVTTQAPYYGTTRVGEWPDPLLPDHAIHVAGGRAQPIWIEVKVPLDAEAGRYEGAITLSADGWTATLPLAVEVWGFDLPKSPTLASSFLLRVRYIYEQHHVERASPAAEALILQYHEAMLDHRIMPTHVATDEIRTRPELSITDDGRLRHADFGAYDAKIRWAMERGQTTFGLEGPRRLNAYSEAYYRAIADHLRERGWLDRFYTYLVDESYDAVAEITGMVRRAAPDLKNLITMPPNSAYPDVDWWCPRLGDAELNKKSICREYKETGRDLGDLWVYTAGNAGSDVPALHLDVDGIEARVTPMAVWKEGYGGLLYWCVNYWTVDPWKDPMGYPRQNGNGSLFYPGPDGPLPSIRLKILRDGFDDVDYAALLVAQDDPLSKRILAAMPLRSALDWDRDPAALMAWRLAAGYALAGDPTLATSYVDKLASLGEEQLGGERAVTDLGDPGSGWHGGKDGHTFRDREDPAYAFTLDADKSKLWRIASPSDLSPYRELRLRVKLVEGDPTVLNVKLGSGIIRRKTWTYEVHCPPDVWRDVRIPLPEGPVDIGSIKELALFVWEPESAHRFELRGIWVR